MRIVALLSAVFSIVCWAGVGFVVAQPLGPADAAPRFAVPVPEPFPAIAQPVLPNEDGFAPMGDGHAPAEMPPAKDCFRLQMEDGSLIIGEMADDTKLKLRAKIGEVEIDFHEVARIDLALTEDDQFAVTLTNGDRLTGRLTLADVQIRASWGDVPVQTKGLFSLEAGKLIEQSAPVTRRSADGRSVVTVSRKYFSFQPTIEGPSAYRNSPPVGRYSNNATYTPSSTPPVARPTPTFSAPAPRLAPQ